MFSYVLDRLGLSQPKVRPQHAELVGTVSELNIYPVKSCARMPMTRLVTSPAGVKHPDYELFDRHIMVTTDNHRYVSIRHYPQMTQIRVSVHDAQLRLDAPGMRTLSLALTHTGRAVTCRVLDVTLKSVDCGDSAAEWMTSFLGNPARVVFTSRDIETRSFPQLADDKWHKIGSNHHKLGYQVYSPYMLMNTASIDDLNTRLDSPVNVNYFRPNILVAGAPAYDEDEWLEVYIGENVRLKNLRPCPRCAIITINPDTAERDPKRTTLETLKKYRLNAGVDKHAPILGINLFLEWAGEMRVGDPVYVVRGKPPLPE